MPTQLIPSKIVNENGRPFMRSIITTPYTIGGETWGGFASAWTDFSTPGWLKKQGQDDITDPFLQHAWLAAIVTTRCRAVAQFPAEMMLGQRGNPSEAKRDYSNDKWSRFFTKPNNDEYWAAFMYRHELYKCIYGRSLWHFRNTSGPCPPIEADVAVFLHPYKYITVVDEKTGVDLYWMPKNSTNPKDRLPLESVAEFQFPNPESKHGGIPPWQAAGLAIDTDYVFELANRAFGRKGFNLGGFVIFKTNDQDVVDAAKVEMKEKWEGPDNSGKYSIIGDTEDIKIIPNLNTHKSMEYVEGGKWNLAKLKAIYQIPDSWLGLGAGVNFATSEAEDEGAYIRVVDPELNEIETFWYYEVHSKLRGGNRWMEFNRMRVPAFQRALVKYKIEQVKELVLMGYNLNAAARWVGLGMSDMAWGDEAYTNGATLKYSSIKAGENISKVTAPTPAEPRSRKPINRIAAPDPIAEGNRLEEAARAKYWNDFAARILDPQERTFKKMLGSYFNQQRSEVIENLHKTERATKRQEFTDSEIESILFSLQKWNKKLLDKAEPIYRGIAAEATKDLAAEIGELTIWNESNPAVTKIIELRGAELVKANETIREELRELLAEASKANLTVAETAKVINSELYDVGGEGGRVRALRIARTETASAANGFRNEAMKAEGIERQEWVSARDAAVRDSHSALDGAVVKVGERFTNGLKYPGDPSGAPEEVINCRCVVSPLMIEENTNEND